MFPTMLTGTLAAALAAIAVVPAMTTAQPPYDPDTHESDIELPERECTSYSWSSQPRVIVHTGSFLSDDEQATVDAIEAVDAQFNLVGATSARITSTTRQSTAYTHKSYYDSSVPTIHVGFTNNANLADSDSWAEAKSWIKADSCSYHSVNIGVDRARDWTFGTPTDSGVDFWEAEEFDNDGDKYFRVSYQHELLHAFDLDHNRDQLSFLNYGNRPWVNRDDDDMIRPLPADIRALRERYPASGSRGEVAVVNTWVGDGQPRNGAGIQGLLCAPSRGSAFSASLFDAHCGTGGAHGGSTTVCAGNLLRTRFAVANYSTDAADVQALLYFSRDAELDETEDLLSPTSFTIDMGAASAARRGYSFQVPEGLVPPSVVGNDDLGGVMAAQRANADFDDPTPTYRPILKLIAVSDEAGADWAVTSDWSPLRGTVTAC